MVRNRSFVSKANGIGNDNFKKMFLSAIILIIIFKRSPSVNIFRKFSHVYLFYAKFLFALFYVYYLGSSLPDPPLKKALIWFKPTNPNLTRKKGTAGAHHAGWRAPGDREQSISSSTPFFLHARAGTGNNAIFRCAQLRWPTMKYYGNPFPRF